MSLYSSFFIFAIVALVMSRVTSLNIQATASDSTNTTDPHRNDKPVSKPVNKPVSKPERKPANKYPTHKPVHKYPTKKPVYKYPTSKPFCPHPSNRPSKKPTNVPSLSPTSASCECSSVTVEPQFGPSIVACWSGDEFFGVYDVLDTSFSNNYLLQNLVFPSTSNVSNCHKNIYDNISPLTSEGLAYCIDGKCNILYYSNAPHVYSCVSDSSSNSIPSTDIKPVQCPYNLNRKPTCSCQEIRNDFTDSTDVIACWNSTKPDEYFGVYNYSFGNHNSTDYDFSTNRIIKNPDFPYDSVFPTCPDFDLRYDNARPTDLGLAYQIGALPFFVSSVIDDQNIMRFPNCDGDSINSVQWHFQNAAVCPSHFLNPVGPQPKTCSCNKFPALGVGPDVVACWNDLKPDQYIGVYNAADTTFSTNLIQSNPNFPGTTNFASCPVINYDNAHTLSSNGLAYMVGANAYVLLANRLSVISVFKCNGVQSSGGIGPIVPVTCPAIVLKEVVGSLQTSQAEVSQDSKVTIIAVVSIVSIIMLIGVMFILYRKYKSNSNKAKDTEDYTLENFYFSNHDTRVDGYGPSNLMEAERSVQSTADGSVERI